MRHPVIVQKHGVTWRCQCETINLRAAGNLDLGHAFIGVHPVNQHHQHPIDSVAMHSRRGRTTRLMRRGLDPKLMQFDIPMSDSSAVADCLKANGRAAEQAPHHRAVGDGVLHRLEPALNISVQLIIVTALKMGLVRLS